MTEPELRVSPLAALVSPFARRLIYRGAGTKIDPDETDLELLVDGVCRLRIYITGDTLYRPFLAEIPERCGDIDAMIVHLGGTRLLGMLLTMDDRQGVEAAELIRPRLTVPVHYDDYQVFKSPLSDFLTRAGEHGLSGVSPITRGETLSLPVRPSVARKAG